MSRGLTRTLEARFEVLDEQGRRVSLGTVNGSEVELDAGSCTVRLLDAAQPTEKAVS